MRACLTLLTLLAWPLLACSGGEPAGGAPGPGGPSAASAGGSAGGGAGARPPNLLFITLDTTRVDRIGCYGYEGATTPNLDRLAASGALFERAYAHVPLTLPTHASLFTGTYPPEHGIHDNGRNALGPELVTLAEIFRARGFRTGAFVSAVALDSAFGLARGFEVYDDDLGSATGPAQVLTRRGGEVADSALAWLRRVKDEPFFCFAHFYDPHAKYDPPPPFDELHADPYDGEIAYMDSSIGRLMGWLESERLLEDTIVVAIADHGESLGEHGEPTHGAYVFDTTQRIPFLLAAPGRIAPGTLVDALVEQVDVLPTLLGLYGWDVPEQVSGRDLAPLLAGRTLPATPVYAESEYSAINFGWAPLHAVWLGRHKLIEAPKPRLYDVLADPGELEDLADREPERVEALRRALASLRGSMRRHAVAEPERAEELAAQLAGLGYTQSVAPVPAGGDELVDPQDMALVLERFHEAVAHGHAGRHEDMIEPLEFVVEQCPGSVGFRSLLGVAYTETGRTEEGIRELEIAAALDTTYEPTFFYLGRAHLAAGDVEKAIEHFRVATRIQPGAWRPRVPLARLLLEQGDLAGATLEYQRIVELKPGDEDYWMNYARLLASQKRFPALVAALERGIEETRGGVALRSHLAWTLATAPDEDLRDPPRAIEMAQAIVRETERADPHALDVLAAALAAAGRFPEAIAGAEAALALAARGEDPVLVQELEDRLAAYRAGLPIIDG